jgi:hypothetical protein
MTITMDDSGIEDMAGIERFLKGSAGIKLHGVDWKEKYPWVARVLRRFTYLELRKKGKTLVKKYMMRVSSIRRRMLMHSAPPWLQGCPTTDDGIFGNGRDPSFCRRCAA